MKTTEINHKELARAKALLLAIVALATLMAYLLGGF
jgi:hypothetical protein